MRLQLEGFKVRPGLGNKSGSIFKLSSVTSDPEVENKQKIKDEKQEENKEEAKNKKKV